MIFSTNKYERFCSALRNHLHKKAIKYGVLPNDIKNMRKIMIFEAIYCQKEAVPTDITEISSKLLTAVYINSLENSKHFSFKIAANGSFMIERKLYTCLLLSLCKNSRYIKISKIKERIIIKAENIKKESLCIAKAMKGLILFERKTKSSLIILSPTATDKEPLPCNLDLQELYNPFSAVNVFLN